MTNIRNALMQAAGTAASGGATYVEDVFSTHLYTGNGSNGLSINNGIDLDGEGGLVWIKGRTSGGVGSDNHSLATTDQGLTHQLASDLTNGNIAWSNMQSFDDDGFTLTNGGTTNTNGVDYVSWTFRKAPGFFDIQTYTGDGTSNKTISHDLDAVPGLTIIKRLDAAGDWYVQQSNSNDHYYQLNSDAAKTTDGAFWGTNSFTPTQIGVGGTANTNNIDGASYIAYIFANGSAPVGYGETGCHIFGDDSDEPIIKCGTFTTSSTWGIANVECGFEPQWVMYKRADGTDDWYIVDNMRGCATKQGKWNGTDDGTQYSSVSASNDQVLEANNDDAEGSGGRADFYSTGFSVAMGVGSAVHIFIAIRRGPMKEPSAGTDVYIADESHASAYENPMFQGTFPVDMSIFFEETSTNGPYFGSRLTGKGAMEIDQTLALYNENNHVWDYMNGWYNRGSGSDDNNIAHMFRRYPKVFDVVVYTGAGAGTHTHNLKAVPEMMIIKCTSHSNRWIVYHSALGNNQQVHLDENITPTTGQFNDTTPTASVFSVSSNTQSGSAGRTYVALLFASLSGISKVGTYTGTGSDLNVTDLGAPVRYLLVKRTDSTSGLSGGHWAVFDSTTQGINSGYDPFPYLSQHDAMTTNIDIVDQHSSGFSVNGNTDHDFNVSGATYIYLAFA